MSPSTTTAVSPTPRCSVTNEQRPLPASCAAHSPSTAATASSSSACSPTTAPATAASCTHSPAASSVSATCGRGPIGPRQTGKPNDSSAHSSLAGPTARSTDQAANAPEPLTAGSGTTTIDADTQPSATNPRSTEPTCSGPTSSSNG